MSGESEKKSHQKPDFVSNGVKWFSHVSTIIKTSSCFCHRPKVVGGFIHDLLVLYRCYFWLLLLVFNTFVSNFERAERFKKASCCFEQLLANHQYTNTRISRSIVHNFSFMCTSLQASVRDERCWCWKLNAQVATTTTSSHHNIILQ